MRTHRLLSTALVLGLAIAAPATAQRDEGESPQDVKDRNQTRVDVCEDGDLDVDFVGDLKLWPPNHKYSPLIVEATNEGGSDITLTTVLNHDEYVEDWDPTSDEEPEEEVGAGNTVNDARPFATSDTEASPNTNEHEVRAERSGRGDGRTYTVDVMANDGDNSCEGSVEVEVPHDMRSHKADAKKDKTGSTGPNQDG